MKIEELIVRDETKSETKVRLKAVVESVYRLDISRNNRQREYVSARISYIRIMRDVGFGVQDIGRSINKHHSSVIHNDKKFDVYYKFDKRFRKFHNIILEKFYVDEDTVIDYKVDELENDNKSLNLKIKELHSQNELLKLKVQSLENQAEKNKSLHEMINTRVKPGTENEIHSKLNRFFNGVYS